MKIKKSYLLIIIFSLIISCSNPSTNPDNNNNNTSSVKAVTSGIYAIQYGSKTSEIDVTDKEGLKTLWLNLVGGKIVYEKNDYTTESGKFDTDGNYYDNKSPTEIKTKFIECGVYEYNSKKYLAAIYWDNETGVGKEIRYRLIIADENGAEQAFKPDENTIWTKYGFVFGYIKNY